MVKVVYNTQYGGFSISKKCAEWMSARGHKEAIRLLEGQAGEFYGFFDGPRHDSLLVMAVEKLKEEASGDMANLAVKKLKGKKYFIREYDGAESVVEPQDVKWIEV